MTSIKILPAHNTFQQWGSQSLLDGALKAGIAVAYGCSNGNCGACKAKLLQGHIERIRYHDYVLPEAEKGAGYFLMCAHKAKSDLVIEAEQACGADDIPMQQVKTRVKKFTALDERVNLLRVQTPRTQTLRFLAGQKVVVTLPDDSRATLAIASCPCDERNIEFHIPLNGSPFAQHPLPALKMNDTILLEGPLGDFTLESFCEKPSLFIAEETGFAAIKSLIEHAFSLEMSCPLELHLMHRSDKHYLHNLARSWQDAMDNVVYRTYPGNAMENCLGLFNDILKRYPALSGIHIYLAGTDSITRCFMDQVHSEGLPDDPVKIF